MPTQTLNVAIIGVGLVGKAFINQASRIPNLRIVALSSSTRSIYDPKGIPFDQWDSALKASTASADVSALVSQLSSLDEPVAIVDNTSSDAIAALYPTFLSSGFHVVTPNKRAYSSSLPLFNEILSTSSERERKIMFEATVMAGLPVISTLKDLVATGDEVGGHSSLSVLV